MTKMHENELKIDEKMVRALLKSQCAHLADLPLKMIVSSGTDNALFRLGADYVVRLPRVEWEAGGNLKKINKEYEYLPKLAQCLKTPVSEPVFKGESSEIYPWPWLIAKWNEGHNPDFEKENEYELLAKDLAYFLNDLHEIKIENAPLSRRGISLTDQELNLEMNDALDQLEGELDVSQVRRLWNQLSNRPAWKRDPVWVHGDFLPGNILIQNNRLNAVIDFTDTGIGDPACDLAIAWSLFNSHSREIFKAHLKNIDQDTWQRGCGWALSIAVIMLPYYKYSNLTLATLARRIIKNILIAE